MHATFFGIKRWHLQIVEASKRLLQPEGLTPARFDMMRAIAARDGQLVQRNLQYLLGVSAVTISKMVKGLVQKGYVVRERLPRDRRFKNVIITPSGYKALRADLEYCVKSRINEYLAAALVTGDRYANIDSRSVRRRIEKTNDHLVRGRRILRDRSPVRHPWARGDFATLPIFALVHERNRHPLRRRRRPERTDAPLPWEIPPKPIRHVAKAPRRGPGPRRTTARADMRSKFDDRAEVVVTAADTAAAEARAAAALAANARVIAAEAKEAAETAEAKVVAAEAAGATGAEKARDEAGRAREAAAEAVRMAREAEARSEAVDAEAAAEAEAAIAAEDAQRRGRARGTRGPRST